MVGVSRTPCSTPCQFPTLPPGVGGRRSPRRCSMPHQPRTKADNKMMSSPVGRRGARRILLWSGSGTSPFSWAADEASALSLALGLPLLVAPPLQMCRSTALATGRISSAILWTWPALSEKSPKRPDDRTSEGVLVRRDEGQRRRPVHVAGLEIVDDVLSRPSLADKVVEGDEHGRCRWC